MQILSGPPNYRLPLARLCVTQSDDEVVAQPGERAAAAHFDGDQRGGRVDAQHPLALRLGLAVVDSGEFGRRLRCRCRPQAGKDRGFC